MKYVMGPRKLTSVKRGNPMVEERQKELLRLTLKGNKPSDAVSDISEKFDVTERTVWEDWNNRNEWLQNIITLQESDKLLRSLLFEMRVVREELWKTYEEADNSNARVGALRALQKNIKSVSDVLEDREVEELEERIETLEKVIEVRT